MPQKVECLWRRNDFLGGRMGCLWGVNRTQQAVSCILMHDWSEHDPSQHLIGLRINQMLILGSDSIFPPWNPPKTEAKHAGTTEPSEAEFRKQRTQHRNIPISQFCHFTWFSICAYFLLIKGRRYANCRYLHLVRTPSSGAHNQ